MKIKMGMYPANVEFISFPATQRRLLQNFDCMRQDRTHGRQTFSHAFNASGQVDYQGGLPDTRHCPGERRARCYFKAFKAHQFRDTWNVAINHRKRGLRGDIAWREARSPRCNDKPVVLAAGPAKS